MRYPEVADIVTMSFRRYRYRLDVVIQTQQITALAFLPFLLACAQCPKKRKKTPMYGRAVTPRALNRLGKCANHQSFGAKVAGLTLPYISRLHPFALIDMVLLPRAGIDAMSFGLLASLRCRVCVGIGTMSSRSWRRCDVVRCFCGGWHRCDVV